jgi:hypothetical protein
MAVDKTIKVWDLRNHKCLQTIAEVRSKGGGWRGAPATSANLLCLPTEAAVLITLPAGWLKEC